MDSETALRVRVVYIAGLARHLSKGWSEDQLVSGRVAVLGREEADFTLAEESPTLGDLALAVQDRWGAAIKDQAYRGSGRTLVPSRPEDAALNLRGFIPRVAGTPGATALKAGARVDLRILLSAGKAGTEGMTAADGSGSGTATRERGVPTSVLTCSAAEADASSSADAAAAPPAQAAAAGGVAFAGRGQRLGGATSASAAPSPADRRQAAADAAARRAAAADAAAQRAAAAVPFG